MQEIHSLGGGGGGRFFGGGDRRLRLHHHQNQALKCPRCDSLNTKFCYYNNYNLSQPRHFCKNCRRYWTKGGILRNVPVGGGCRNPKRNHKPKPPPDDAAPRRKNSTSRSGSSSDSSSLTASAAANHTSTAAPPRSDPSTSSALSFPPESTFFLPNPNPNSFETPKQHQHVSPLPIFPGGFASLITDPSILSYNAPSSSTGPLPFPLKRGGEIGEEDEELKMTSRFLDPTVQLEANGADVELLPPLDWPSGAAGAFAGDQGFFDLAGAVDQLDEAYWSQNQWTTTDDQHHRPLYLP